MNKVCALYLDEEIEIGGEGVEMSGGVGGCVSQHAAGAELPSVLPPANTCFHFASSTLLALRSSDELRAP